MAASAPRQKPAPAPSNPVLLAAQAQWLFTNEELTRAPSQLDGMKMDQENVSRSKGVSFITQVGIMLKLPQLTLATAAVYFHRFFMRYSMVDLPQRPGMHPYPIAATSLFLATKVEENVRRMREIVVACCRVAQKQPNLVVDEQSKEFWKWRDTILHHEDLLLEALCFDLQLEQPYRVLYDFLCYFRVNEDKNLRNAAWAFINDSMFTVLCLQFSARIIAAAALYAAARHCDIAFEDNSTGQSWWEQIDVDLSEVRRACTRMAELYENNAANKHSQYYPTTPFLWDEATEKTRIPNSGTSLEVPDAPSRKRSRQPEGESQERHNTQHASSSQVDEASQNGTRSPKRPRVGSDAEKTRSTATSFTSSSTSLHGGVPAPPPTSPLAHERPPNGNHAHSHQHQPHRYQHPLPPTPRTTFPPRQNSDKNVDPIQQRIDQIVQQNSASPPKHNKRIPDSRYREDEHTHHRRNSSFSSSTRNDHPPPPPEHNQPPPPPPPEPGPDDEGGGSEEGEV